MQSHESFANSTSQVATATVEVVSADQRNRRRVGIVAVLSNDPILYSPGAFGGAVIRDPWETLEEYKRKLEHDEGVDLVLPLCHLYEWQDNVTASRFDFPVILSGHDHHEVDRVINGTRLLKPGTFVFCLCIMRNTLVVDTHTHTHTQHSTAHPHSVF